MSTDIQPQIIVDDSTESVAAELSELETPISQPADENPSVGRVRTRKWRAAPAWHTDYEPENRSWYNIFWLLWWLYGALYLDCLQWVPTPHYWGFVKSRTRLNQCKIKALDCLIFGIYVYRSIKGGVGKTPAATWVGTEISQVGVETSLIVDLDSGARGKAAHRLDVDMQTEQYDLETVQDLILARKTYLTRTDLRKMLPIHKESGAALLAPNRKLKLSGYKTGMMLDKFHDEFGVIVIDSTPGISEENIEGAHDATITTIPSRYGSHDLYFDILSIRDEMNNGKVKGQYDQLVKEGRLFLEINGVPRSKFNRRTQYDFAQKLSVSPHQVILMPYDQYVMDNGPVRRAKVSKRFLYAVSEQARTLTEAAAEYNKTHPWALPAPAVKEDLGRHKARLIERLIGLHDGSAPETAKAILAVATAAREDNDHS